MNLNSKIQITLNTRSSQKRSRRMMDNQNQKEKKEVNLQTKKELQ